MAPGATVNSPRLSIFAAGLFWFLLILRLFSGPIFDREREVAGFQIGRSPSWSIWTHAEVPGRALATAWSGDEHGQPFLTPFEWLVSDGLWLSGASAMLSASALDRRGRLWLAILLGTFVTMAGVGWVRSFLLVAHSDFARGLHFLEPAFLPVVPSTSLLPGESTAGLWQCPLVALRCLDFLSEHRLATTLFVLWIGWVSRRPRERHGAGVPVR